MMALASNPALSAPAVLAAPLGKVPVKFLGKEEGNVPLNAKRVVERPVGVPPPEKINLNWGSEYTIKARPATIITSAERRIFLTKFFPLHAREVISLS